MKTLFILILITPFIYSQSEPADTSQFGKIIVNITGFENNDGDCRFAINNSEELHEREDTVFIGLILPIENHKVEVEIDSLPYGWYAIKVLHDENRNSELDTDFLGIPSENFGYSNNVSSWFGPPRWDRAKFHLHQEILLLEIEVD
jgi:uncharacterized protein (DUF2141 family)